RGASAARSYRAVRDLPRRRRHHRSRRPPDRSGRSEGPGRVRDHGRLGRTRSGSIDGDPSCLRRGRRVTEKNRVTAIRDTLDDEMPAFDQILSEASRMRYRTNGDWGCPMVIRAPCGGGIHGALYHSQSIEAFYAHIPGVKVVMPSTPADAAGLLHTAIADPDPVLFLE